MFINRWMEKWWYMHTSIQWTTQHKKGILDAYIWINLQTMMKDKKMYKYGIIPFSHNSRKFKWIYSDKAEQWFPGDKRTSLRIMRGHKETFEGWVCLLPWLRGFHGCVRWCTSIPTCLKVSYWWLEPGYGGSIYTTEMSKRYNIRAFS